MNIKSRTSASLLAAAMFVVPAWSAASAQELRQAANADQITVYGEVPSDLSGLAEGPEVDGFISARRGNQMRVTSADGSTTDIYIADATRIRSSGGFLGLGRTSLASDSLLNGIPVAVETLQFDGGLVASRIRFSDNDLETAAMIRNGTSQGFAEQTAATEALRGRVANIDQYNIRGVTNVYFDTGKSSLSGQARSDLCAVAAQANATDNALLLVVGYTDSVGSQEYNQVLSERRAGGVVNFLQQECGWAPYRMLTPTGMAESSPAASNDTVNGKAQNRRVAVNVLVSKAVDGL